MKKIAVTRKSQVTIPADIRKKLGLQEGMRVTIWEEGGKVVMKPLPSILSMAGSGSGKASPGEMKKMLDKLREEDL
jgi:AbrB family looped-hinge helix DNA binding protein